MAATRLMSAEHTSSQTTNSSASAARLLNPSQAGQSDRLVSSSRPYKSGRARQTEVRQEKAGKRIPVSVQASNRDTRAISLPVKNEHLSSNLTMKSLSEPLNLMIQAAPDQHKFDHSSPLTNLTSIASLAIFSTLVLVILFNCSRYRRRRQASSKASTPDLIEEGKVQQDASKVLHEPQVSTIESAQIPDQKESTEKELAIEVEDPRVEAVEQLESRLDYFQPKLPRPATACSEPTDRKAKSPDTVIARHLSEVNLVDEQASQSLVAQQDTERLPVKPEEEEIELKKPTNLELVDVRCDSIAGKMRGADTKQVSQDSGGWISMDGVALVEPQVAAIEGFSMESALKDNLGQAPQTIDRQLEVEVDKRVEEELSQVGPLDLGELEGKQTRKYFIYIVQEGQFSAKKECIARIEIEAKRRVTLSELRQMIVNSPDISLSSLKRSKFKFVTETYRLLNENEDAAILHQFYPTQAVFVKQNQVEPQTGQLATSGRARLASNATSTAGSGTSRNQISTKAPRAQ